MSKLSVAFRIRRRERTAWRIENCNLRDRHEDNDHKPPKCNRFAYEHLKYAGSASGVILAGVKLVVSSSQTPRPFRLPLSVLHHSF